MLTDLPQFVPQKVCLSCDGCCRFKEEKSPWRPKITRDEMNERALGGSGLVASIFSKQRDEDGYVKAVPCPTGAQCVFFHPPDNTCRVYADRPFEAADLSRYFEGRQGTPK